MACSRSALEWGQVSRTNIGTVNEKRCQAHSCADGGGQLYLTASTVSGSRALGFSSSELGFQAVVLSGDGSVVPLFENPAFQSIPVASILRGRVVMGFHDGNLSPDSFDADDSFFVNRLSGKVVLLSEILAVELPQLSEWSRMTVKAVSADGNTVVGEGINPTGGLESWTISGFKKPLLARLLRKP